MLTWESAEWSVMIFPSTNSVRLNEIKEKRVFSEKKISIFVYLRKGCLHLAHTTSASLNVMEVYSPKISLLQSGPSF